jgi:SAM-dependent methyltransferase
MVLAIVTPLPAASPSALTTMGAPWRSTYARAGASSVNVTWRAVGIDPAENLVAAANAAGRKTVLGFLNDTTVDEVLRDHGEAMLVTANNVFAHTPDWSRFVACVDRLLAPGGRCAIEFPYGPTMLRDGFFDISYFEHYSYPALGPVQRLLAPRGFSIIDVEEMPAVHGGSVRLWIGRETDTRWTPSPRVARMISEEQARRSRSGARRRPGWKSRGFLLGSWRVTRARCRGLVLVTNHDHELRTEPGAYCLAKFPFESNDLIARPSTPAKG